MKRSSSQWPNYDKFPEPLDDLTSTREQTSSFQNFSCSPQKRTKHSNSANGLIFQDRMISMSQGRFVGEDAGDDISQGKFGVQSRAHHTIIERCNEISQTVENEELAEWEGTQRGKNEALIEPNRPILRVERNNMNFSDLGRASPILFAEKASWVESHGYVNIESTADEMAMSGRPLQCNNYTNQQLSSIGGGVKGNPDNDFDFLAVRSIAIALCREFDNETIDFFISVFK